MLGVYGLSANRHGAYWVDAPLLLFAGEQFTWYLAVVSGAVAFGLVAIGRKRIAVGAWVFFFLFTGLSSYGLVLRHWWTFDAGKLPRIAAIIKECLPDKAVGQHVVFICHTTDVKPYILQYHLGATVKWHWIEKGVGEVDCSLLDPYEIAVSFGDLNVECGFETLARDGDTAAQRIKKDLHGPYVRKSAEVRGLLWDMDCVANRVSGREVAPPYVLGRKLNLSEEEAEPFLGWGWTGKSPLGRWTEGAEATLSFRLDQPISLDLLLVIDGHPLVTETHPQRVFIRVGDQTLAEMTLSHQSRTPVPVRIPRSLVDGTGVLNITISTPDAVTPKELGINWDTRRLGLCVRAVVLQPVRQEN